MDKTKYTIINNIGKRSYIFFLFLIFSLTTIAEERYDTCYNDSTVVTVSHIYYPVNKVTIYEDYMSNPIELESIKRHLAQSPRIDSITIYSYASPEGPYNWNVWLARERGKTAKRYIKANIPKDRYLPDSLIILDPTPENWAGMREEVVKLYDRPDKDQVLEIIDRPGITDERRKKLIQKLDNGKSWKFILKNIMPQLRHATWISVWSPINNDTYKKVTPLETTNTFPKLSIPQATPELSFPSFLKPREEFGYRTILALKTNMLYDALTWLNFSVEAPLGPKFSALYYHQFPWWRWGESRNEYCNRFLSIGGEARWWFKPEFRPVTEKFKIRDRLVGQFIGIYCESGKWDFERKRDICYQGEHWSVGVSYGYSMPISRSLNLEFSLSCGYASIAYRGYTPSEDYSILWRDYSKIGRWHYFGPTKAQVTLAIPIIIKTKKRTIW